MPPVTNKAFNFTVASGLARSLLRDDVLWKPNSMAETAQRRVK